MAKYASFTTHAKSQHDTQRKIEGDGQKQILTEASVGVLSLDTLSPVLREEHVGRESTLGGLGILLGFASPRGFFNLFSSLALD